VSTQPENTRERIFAFIIALVGLVVFGTFVSTITLKMTYIRSFNKAKAKEDATLQRYLLENNISMELALRILGFAHVRRSAKPCLKGFEVPAIKDLPTELAVQLDFEVYSQVILLHPFFDCLHIIDPASTMQICNEAVGEHNVLSGQSQFAKGKRAEKMYFVLSGSMHYQRMGKTYSLEHGRWISESALWIENWVHRGSLVAAKESELFGLSPPVFHAILQTRDLCQKPSDYVHKYAASFVRDKSEHLEAELRLSDCWADHDRLLQLAEHAFDASSL
jgi:hypothetical protein